MMVLGWAIVISTIVFVIAGLLIALTFDSGPDWLHQICLVAIWLSSATGIVSVVLIVGSAIGINVSIALGGES